MGNAEGGPPRGSDAECTAELATGYGKEFDFTRVDIYHAMNGKQGDQPPGALTVDGIPPHNWATTSSPPSSRAYAVVFGLSTCSTNLWGRVLPSDTDTPLCQDAFAPAGIALSLRSGLWLDRRAGGRG